MTVQTKILDLSLTGSEWPDLDHMLAVEPITVVQWPHAAPKQGRSAGTPHGLPKWSVGKEGRVAAVETRPWETWRWGEGGL